MSAATPGDLSGRTFVTAGGVLEVQRLLGRGKSGYSWLAIRDGVEVVLKLMHDEPNPYYVFNGNKVEAEVSAWHRLSACGIPVPALLEHDAGGGYLVKACIAGTLAAEAIARGTFTDDVFRQLFTIAHRLQAHGLNTDTFPTNFIITPSGLLVCIDYEVNPYQPEWSLEQWGIYYWINPAGMRAFLETGDAAHINADIDRGQPHRAGFEAQVRALIERWGKA